LVVQQAEFLRTTGTKRYGRRSSEKTRFWSWYLSYWWTWSNTLFSDWNKLTCWYLMSATMRRVTIHIANCCGCIKIRTILIYGCWAWLPVLLLKSVIWLSLRKSIERLRINSGKFCYFFKSSSWYITL
jgi:hypothetical protein